MKNKPADDFLSMLSAPARRALQQKGITTVEALAVFTETEIAALHGIGPESIRTLRNILSSNHLTFKK
jgi:predicted RecB family nuclease